MDDISNFGEKGERVKKEIKLLPIGSRIRWIGGEAVIEGILINDQYRIRYNIVAEKIATPGGTAFYGSHTAIMADGVLEVITRGKPNLSLIQEP